MAKEECWSHQSTRYLDGPKQASEGDMANMICYRSLSGSTISNALRNVKVNDGLLSVGVLASESTLTKEYR